MINVLLLRCQGLLYNMMGNEINLLSKISKIYPILSKQNIVLLFVVSLLKHLHQTFTQVLPTRNADK